MDACGPCSLCHGSEVWRLKAVDVEVEGWFKVVHPSGRVGGWFQVVHPDWRVEGWFQVVHPSGDRLVHAERRVRRGMRCCLQMWRVSDGGGGDGGGAIGGGGGGLVR